MTKISTEPRDDGMTDLRIGVVRLALTEREAASIAAVLVATVRCFDCRRLIEGHAIVDPDGTVWHPDHYPVDVDHPDY